jgi:hypothetical protein
MRQQSRAISFTHYISCGSLFACGGFFECAFDGRLDCRNCLDCWSKVLGDGKSFATAAAKALGAKGTTKRVSHDPSGRGLWVEFEIA